MASGWQGNTEPARRLQSYLRPGEALLWSGKPDPAVVLAGSDAVAIPFSIIWLVISVGWVAGARSSGAPQAFWLLGTPSVAIGIYLLIGRLVVRQFRRRRTVYGLTSERVLVVTGCTFSAAPVAGGSMSVRRSRSGRHATVVFEPFGSYWAEQTTMTGPPMPGAGVPTMTSTRRRIAPGQSVFHDVANPDEPGAR